MSSTKAFEDHGPDGPGPSAMPIDTVAWAKKLSLSNFVNASYQLRDVEVCGDAKRILVIGPGQGLDTAVFRWRGYDVVTFDIDSTFKPDFIGSCHDMPMFGNREFDVVIASHILEHLPLPYLDRALCEIARVARFALVYLPVAGRHFLLRLSPPILGLDLSVVVDLLPFWHKPDGITPRYCEGQHYWELGMRGFRATNLALRLSKHFQVIRAYRNKDWLPSYNFVLKSRASS